MNAAPNLPITPFPTAPVSGLTHLRNEVARYFDDKGIPAVIAKVGLKYRSFNVNQSVPGGANRIVFIPGEFDGSLAPKPRAYGTLSRNTRNTTVVNPRELAQWERPVTLSVWSAPAPGKTDDEELAHEQAENLLEHVVQAVSAAQLWIPDMQQQNMSIAGAVSFGDVTINSPPNESSFGVELLVALTLRGPFFDIARDVAYPVLKFQTPVTIT